MKAEAVAQVLAKNAGKEVTVVVEGRGRDYRYNVDSLAVTATEIVVLLGVENRGVFENGLGELLS